MAKGHALNDDDRMRALVIEQLMCRGRVDLGELSRRYGAPADWWHDALEELEPLVADDLVLFDDHTLQLTDRGLPLVRVVAAAFDSYRRRAPARHSVAV